MVERYVKLKPFLDTADDDSAVYMLSPLEEERFHEVLEEIKDFEPVSKKLQEETSRIRERFELATVNEKLSAPGMVEVTGADGAR
ncbi:hypothetical protein PC116_g17502 [Phytophthora cactorum]|nr:hypothetical protein PC116_g17502 [Phytophthora cactorum]